MTAMRCLLVSLLAVFLVGCSQPKAGGYRVYVTNEVSGDLTIIDSDKLETIARVPLGKRPRGIHASPDGKTIYIALSGSPIGGPGVDESTLPPPDKNADGIGVFDVDQQKLVKVIHGGSDPEEFALTKDGKQLYIANEDVGGASILDLAQGKIIKEFKTGEEPEGVELSPDGKWILVTSEDAGTVAVVDTEKQELIKNIKVGRRPRSMAFLPDGTRAWVNAENDGTIVMFDVLKGAVLETVPLGEAGVIKPMKVILAPDKKTLIVSTGRGKLVKFVDAESGKTLGEVEAGRRPWGLGLSPDGKTLFTANGPGNDVSIIDVEQRKVIKRVDSPGSPWGVLVLPR
jgi:YVTN family beta-propeller protein